MPGDPAPAPGWLRLSPARVRTVVRLLDVALIVGEAVTHDALVAARDTQTAEIDSGTTISFGARASEAPFRDSLVALGMFLADDYPPGFTSTQDRFDAASARAIQLFNSTGGPNAILEVNGDFGLATSQVREAKTRHSDRKQFLNGLLSEIESVNKEEVAVSLTTLQTQLEASYQVTARLSQLSLTNYL